MLQDLLNFGFEGEIGANGPVLERSRSFPEKGNSKNTSKDKSRQSKGDAPMNPAPTCNNTGHWKRNCWHKEAMARTARTKARGTTAELEHRHVPCRQGWHASSDSLGATNLSGFFLNALEGVSKLNIFESNTSGVLVTSIDSGRICMSATGEPKSTTKASNRSWEPWMAKSVASECEW